MTQEQDVAAVTERLRDQGVDLIQPSANTPTAAISTDRGDATPPPLAEALVRGLG